jgi:hypothetical protein
MVEPFKTVPKGLTHLLVAMDKFTKWIKAKLIKKLNGSSTIKFFNEIIVITGQTLQKESSRNSVPRKASGWTWHQWHTLNPTGKWRRQMV